MAGLLLRAPEPFALTQLPLHCSLSGAMNDQRPWIGFTEAAELCGVCVQTIRNHEKRGAFRSRWFSQLGLHGGRLIEKKSLLEWRKARKGWDELIAAAPDELAQKNGGGA